MQKNVFKNSLFHTSTCFEHMCSSSGDKIALHSLWYHHTYMCDDTRGCVGVFHCTRSNTYRFADSLRASCQQTCMTYTIVVFTVKNSWWWTEELSETCRLSLQNKFEKLVLLIHFVIRICHDVQSHERKMCGVFTCFNRQYDIITLKLQSVIVDIIDRLRKSAVHKLI